MGVRGLTSVINSSSFGTHVPDITQLPGKLLVVDGFGVLYKTYLERFLEKGITLIVFLDGVSPETKNETAKDRFLKRSQDCNDLALCTIGGTYEVFNYLPASLYLRAIFKYTLQQLQQKYTELLKFEVCCGEADPIIAKYAADNNATGVLANDSDFFVFPNIKYFPLPSITFNDDGSVSGTYYSSESIAASLSIEPWQYRLAILYLGTDHCSSTTNSGTPQQKFDYAIKMASILKEDEVEQYFERFWGNETEGCHAALQFYNHETSWELKDLVPIELQSDEFMSVIKQLFEKDVSYVMIEALLYGSTNLPISGAKYNSNVRLLEKTRPIRKQILQLFYHHMAHHEYTTKEKIANSKNNMISASIVLTKDRSLQKAAVTNLLAELAQLPQQIKWKNSEDLGVYYEDLSVLSEPQRRILSCQFFFTGFLEKVNFKRWWLISRQYRDAWFLSTLIILDQINPLKDWELQLFVALHFNTKKVVNNYKSVPNQVLKSDVERCNNLFNLFEVTMYNVEIVNHILGIPSPSNPPFQELNACYFYEIYLKAASKNADVFDLLQFEKQQRSTVLQYVNEFKTCCDRNQPVPQAQPKTNSKKPKTPTILKSDPSLSLSNRFGSLLLE